MLNVRKKCPKCGCPAYSKQGAGRVKCKYCGCKYKLEIKKRETVKCPYCKSLNTTKDGFNSEGVQKFLCKDCGMHFRNTYKKIPRISEYTKQKVRLYKKGGFSNNFIAKMFKIDPKSVTNILKGESYLNESS